MNLTDDELLDMARLVGRPVSLGDTAEDRARALADLRANVDVMREQVSRLRWAYQLEAGQRIVVPCTGVVATIRAVGRNGGLYTDLSFEERGVPPWRGAPNALIYLAA